MPVGKTHRIDQLLSQYGYCSRREARAWLAAGRVLVDGVPARSADQRVPVGSVRIDGEPVDHPDGILVVLHKPAGCVCSHDTGEGQTVYDLLPARWRNRNPVVTTVGRLDRDTTGVLLLTDDGTLVQRWTSPKRKVPKVYEVTVDADLPAGLGDLFASGTLMLEGEDRPCLPATLEPTGPRTARLELVEGRFHQVKRMFAAQGLEVTALHRSRFGRLELGDLAPGRWRSVGVEEVDPG